MPSVSASSSPPALRKKPQSQSQGGRSSAAKSGRPLSNQELKDRRKEIAFPESMFLALLELADREGTDVNKIVRRACENELNRLPVLGTIPCGALSELGAIEDYAEEWMPVGGLLKTRPGDYLLRCYGDSMTGDGIYEGDCVQIRPQDVCDNNDIAAVAVSTPFGWKSTLKRVLWSVDSPIVTLQPMNPGHDPIFIDTSREEVKICGVFKGLIRRR